MFIKILLISITVHLGGTYSPSNPPPSGFNQADTIYIDDYTTFENFASIIFQGGQNTGECYIIMGNSWYTWLFRKNWAVEFLNGPYFFTPDGETTNTVMLGGSIEIDSALYFYGEKMFLNMCSMVVKDVDSVRLKDLDIRRASFSFTRVNSLYIYDLVVKASLCPNEINYCNKVILESGYVSSRWQTFLSYEPAIKITSSTIGIKRVHFFEVDTIPIYYNGKNTDSLTIDSSDFRYSRSLVIDSAIVFIIKNTSFCKSQYDGALKINNSEAVFSNVSFDSCGGREKGGGIYSQNSTIVLLDSRLKRCYANDGGAIFAGKNTNIEITGCELIECYAEDDGGGIYVDSFDIFSFNSSYVCSCSADNGGAIFCFHYDSIFIYNSSFFDNTSINGAGGLHLLKNIHTDSKNSVIQLSYFLRNCGDAGGGLFYMGYDTLGVINCLFVNDSSCSQGGGITASIPGPVAIKNTTFRDCYAYGWGGAVCGVNYVNMNNCCIAGCNSDVKGGGLYIDGNCLINRTVFLKNISEDGGGIFLSSGNLEIYSTNFTGNISRKNGGAFFLSSGEACVESCQIVDNCAIDTGSGFYINSAYASVKANNLYYNSILGDISVYQATGDASDFTFNYWFNDNPANITFNVNYIPMLSNPGIGASFEPSEVDSVLNMNNAYSERIDSIGTGDTLFISLWGRSSKSRKDIAGVYVVSRVADDTVFVGLLETGDTSGIFRNICFVNDGLYPGKKKGEAYNILMVSSSGDSIEIIPLVAPEKKVSIFYKLPTGLNEIRRIQETGSIFARQSFISPVIGRCAIRIYTPSGSLCYREDITITSRKIHLPALKNGLYYVYLEKDGKQWKYRWLNIK